MMTSKMAAPGGVVRVRLSGCGFDIPLRELNVTAGADERALKTALAGYLAAPPQELDDWELERHAGGSVTLREVATCGR
ncbi:MAG: hypothetical protein ACK47B_10380 [Armatimonadota bacterium]